MIDWEILILDTLILLSVCMMIFGLIVLGTVWTENLEQETEMEMEQEQK